MAIQEHSAPNDSKPFQVYDVTKCSESSIDAVEYMGLCMAKQMKTFVCGKSNQNSKTETVSKCLIIMHLEHPKPALDRQSAGRCRSGSRLQERNQKTLRIMLALAKHHKTFEQKQIGFQSRNIPRLKTLLHWQTLASGKNQSSLTCKQNRMGMKDQAGQSGSKTVFLLFSFSSPSESLHFLGSWSAQIISGSRALPCARQWTVDGTHWRTSWPFCTCEMKEGALLRMTSRYPLPFTLSLSLSLRCYTRKPWRHHKKSGMDSGSELLAFNGWKRCNMVQHWIHQHKQCASVCLCLCVSTPVSKRHCANLSISVTWLEQGARNPWLSVLANEDQTAWGWKPTCKIRPML